MNHDTSCGSPKWILLVPATYLLIVIIWSMVIPFHGAPDESTHFFLVEYWTTYGVMPKPDVDPVASFIGALSGREITNKQFWYHGMPNLYAIGGTLTAKLIGPFLPDGVRYLSVRAFNWILAPIFAMSIMMILIRSGVYARRAAFLAFMVILIPQVTFIFSYFNADALSLTISSLAVLSFTAYLQKPSLFRSFLFGISLGAVMVSKVYYFPAILFLIVALFVANRISLVRSTLQSLFFIVFFAATVSIPILIWTYLQYGEVLGLGGQADFVARYFDPATSSIDCLLACDSDTINYVGLFWWLVLYAMSFFFALGWMDIVLPKAFYLAYFFPLALAFFIVSGGKAIRCFRCRDAGLLNRVWIPTIFVLFACMSASVVIANILGSAAITPQPQGRYHFVVIPFSIFLIGLIFSRERPIPGLNKSSTVNFRHNAIFSSLRALLLGTMIVANLLGVILLATDYRVQGGLPLIEILHR